jgi:predicted CopG family antitoxin
MHKDYYFMKSKPWRNEMANLQIKGVDDAIYEELKKLAAAENRSVSQQTLFLIKDYLAKKQRVQTLKTPVQVLLELAGSWEGEETAEEIIAKIKKARKSSTRLKEGF